MKQNGFTLVEMLIALVIGGILLASLSTIISGLANELTHGRQANQQIETYRKLSGLKNILEGSQYVQENGRPLLQSENLLRLRIRAPFATRLTGWVDARLEIKKTGENKELLLSIPSYPNIPEDILISRAEDIDLHISFKETEDQTRAIDAIMINILIDGSQDYKIVAHPKATPEKNCIFDLISQRCR